MIGQNHNELEYIHKKYNLYYKTFNAFFERNYVIQKIQLSADTNNRLLILYSNRLTNEKKLSILKIELPLRDISSIILQPMYDYMLLNLLEQM